ncbi:coagulase (plasmid) [Staphylococcus agnetis]|uniref:coagulase domain-containing protein n=1 Tax=Staphylococcus agnetis TaxID=985762 RepID=UPI001181286A|nr:coagulase domain-containing protein [Staphylococcus agnetis]TRW80393.1 coagulase [Staphylococcus agnetis]
MKKKLICLSLTAVCATQLLTYKDASAIVTGEKNPYQSSSLKLNGKISHPHDVERYYNSLNDYVYNKSINMHAGYDEPEYKDALNKYKQKFMAEMEALNKYRKEQEQINKVQGYWYKDKVPSNTYGLTYERYYSLYKKLEENREEFFKEVKKIESENIDLKRFDEETQYEKGFQINQLENKILMVGKAFIKENPLAVQNMYNKLDMVLGTTNKEYKNMVPTNERMFKMKSQDLEFIIDDFFEEINLARPHNIIPLTKENQDNKQLQKQLREDAKAAKDNVKLRDPKTKERSEKAKKVEEDFKTIKAKGSEKKYDDEYEEIRKRAIKKINFNINGSVASLDYDEDSKKESKQKSKRKADQEPQQINNLSHIEKVINNTVKYEPKPQFNNNIVDTKNNISEYNDSSVKYGPRPQFNSNVVSTKNNITEYSNGSVKYGPRPQFNSNVVSTKNNITEYSNGSVKYGPRPQFNSNVVSAKNNITEYSNGSVKYGPRL